MLTDQRKQELLAYAKKSLAKWNALDPRFKGPSDRPYANTIGCEELIALLEEVGVPDLNTVTYGGQSFQLTDDEVASLLPIGDEAYDAAPNASLYANDEVTQQQTYTRIPEEQRQAEIAEILRRTDELCSQSHGQRVPPVPFPMNGAELAANPPKQRGRPKGQKNQKTIERELAASEARKAAAAIEAAKPKREFKPFGTHNRFQD